MAAYDNLPVLQKLPQAGFNGIDFPVETWSCKGSMRRHIHVYWKTPGGQIEKGGRGPYVFRMKALFHEGTPGMPDLFPHILSQLRSTFEGGETFKLMVPHLGEVDAFCTNWEEQLDGRVQSGAMVELEFEEDSEKEFLVAAMIEDDAASVGTKVDDLIEKAEEARLAALEQPGNIFDAIRDTANAILSLKDQADLYENLLLAKIDGLLALCQKAVDLVELKDPANWPVLDAVLAVWASTKDLADDIQDKLATTLTYETPAEMAIAEIAIAIYKDAERAWELLQINVIEEAYAIPKGTKIRYYEAA